MDLKYGMSDTTLGGYQILELQGKLQTIAQIHGQTDFDPKAIDGVFGPDTRNAVRAFQSSVGITADGIVGDQTQLALESVLQSDPGSIAFSTRQKTTVKRTIPSQINPPTITGKLWSPPDPKTVIDWQTIGIGLAVMAVAYWILKGDE